jgi:hypothetical protein
MSRSLPYAAFVDWVLEAVTPQAMLDFQLPPEARQRAIMLLERNNAGLLSPEEAAELDQMQFLNRLVSLLKAEALKRAPSG